MNTFEITKTTTRNVGELRRSFAEDPSWIPVEAADSDFVVRLEGRCVDGPCVGRRAFHIQLISAELMRDVSAWRQIVESSALQSWSMLPEA